MAGAMIEAARDAARFSGEDNSDNETNDLDDFDEESSISSLPTDEDDDEQRSNNKQIKSEMLPSPGDDTIEATQGIQEIAAGGVYRMKPLPRLEGSKPYQCDICRNSFQQKKSVYRHIKEVHKMTLIFVDDNGNESPVKTTSSIQCEVSGCGLSYPNRELLTKHMNEHKNKRTNDSDSESPQPAKRLTKAPLRKSNGTLGDSRENRLSFKSEIIPYRCVVDTCTLLFQSKELMMRHIQNTHKLKLVLVSESEERKLHHIPDKKFPCGYPDCDSSFTRNSRRREHIIAKHADYEPDSAPPPMLMSTPVNHPKSYHETKLKTEPDRKSATFPKKYACDYPGCDKAYTKSSHVKRHKQSAKQSLKCDECQQTFKRRSDLTRHISRHHPTEEFD